MISVFFKVVANSQLFAVMISYNILFCFTFRHSSYAYFNFNFQLSKITVSEFSAKPGVCRASWQLLIGRGQR